MTQTQDNVPKDVHALVPEGWTEQCPQGCLSPLPHHFWRLEAELKESARPVPPKTSVFGEWTAVSSLSHQLVIPGCVCGPTSSSCEDPSPVGSGPTLVIHSTCIPSLETPISKESLGSWGLAVQHSRSRRTGFTH